jgi:hypothetical protein
MAPVGIETRPFIIELIRIASRLIPKELSTSASTNLIANLKGVWGKLQAWSRKRAPVNLLWDKLREEEQQW